MPTGYTADVQSGEITEFSDFAMNCARAFGALVTMRDEASNADIPDEFEPNVEYHDNLINDALATLERMNTLSEAELQAEADQYYTAAVEDYEKQRAKRMEQKERYKAMLDKAEAWIPPSPDHEELKAFMLKQLRDSLDFDCREYPLEEKRLSAREWRDRQVLQSRRSISYHRDARIIELERVNGRNVWLRQLRKSLREYRHE